MDYILKSIIPIIFILIMIYGMIKDRKVYEWFIEGAKSGLTVCLNIFPYLLAMIIAVKIFKEAGFIDLMNRILSPVGNIIGLPEEVFPLILIKPLSGSGAVGVFTEILREYGPDSFVGLVASVIMGTTETIFYTITIYFGAINIKKIRHTLWTALMADLIAIISSVILVKICIF